MLDQIAAVRNRQRGRRVMAFQPFRFVIQVVCFLALVPFTILGCLCGLIFKFFMLGFHEWANNALEHLGGPDERY